MGREGYKKVKPGIDDKEKFCHLLKASTCFRVLKERDEVVSR